jgi:3-phytase
VEYDVSSLVTKNGPVDLALVNPHSDGLEFSSREGEYAPQLVVTSGTTTVEPVPTSSRTAESVAVTIDSPASGTTYTAQQSVSLAISAVGPSPITQIELFDNGVLTATEDAAPFRYSWAVTSETNGVHVWTAKAYDAAGASASSAPVELTVAIVQETTPTSGDPVTAAGETAPVPHGGDAADDPAIWIHPTNPGLSTIIGTDKLGGLAVYDLRGVQLHYYADGTPNNVDLRYNFPLGGTSTTIVVTSEATADTIRIYRVNPQTRGLEYIAARSITTNIGVAGISMYRSAATGKYYAFVGDNSGTVQQWELFDDGTGKVDARKVRTVLLSSTTEGMVADDGAGALYIAQEDVALWRYGAEPGAGESRTKVEAVDGARLTADIEGLALYYGGPGYLIVSSQGTDDFAVYRRDTNAYVGRFSVAKGSVDAVSYTDGLDVTNASLGGSYASGVFVAQDNTNDSGIRTSSWCRGSASPTLSLRRSPLTRASTHGPFGLVRARLPLRPR